MSRSPIDSLPTAELAAKMSEARELSERNRKQLRYTVGISVCGLLVVFLNSTVLHLTMLMPVVTLLCVFSSICALSLSGGIFGGRFRNLAEIYLSALLPGFVISVDAARHINTIDFAPLALYSFAIGSGLTFLTISLDQTARSLSFAVVNGFIFSVCCGYGVIAETNTALDGSLPNVFPVTVLSKNSFFNRGSTRKSYELTLAPWGPLLERRIVSVSEDLFGAVPSGGTVCVQLRAGGLGIRWYEGVDRCSGRR